MRVTYKLVRINSAGYENTIKVSDSKSELSYWKRVYEHTDSEIYLLPFQRNKYKIKTAAISF